MTLAHVSDLHLDGGARAEERAVRVLDRLRSMPGPFDALLVTGDIADHGTEPEYEAAARLLADFPAPVLCLPGNHDVRGPYRKVLLGEPASDTPVNRLHRVGPLAVLMLDVTVPGRDEGHLAGETAAWVRTTIRDALPPGTPVALALHQPPVALGRGLVDSIMLDNADEFAALISEHPGIVAVFGGHTHSATVTTFADRPLALGPGVTSTLRLDWETGTDEWGEVIDRTAPPGYAVHVLELQAESPDDPVGLVAPAAGTRLTTHFRTCG
ncbi:metallophosphoesterase [Streptomyces sp. LaPpAH-108]|uniref:metallophosphoesterase n=1 Tax=Streptomyces sp. LaPpAH-108 TaxID=1155714 RepID=UPI000371B084|nr:metallophosphoesterase [Streptomyces sp. LaPpAH-108]